MRELMTDCRECRLSNKCPGFNFCPHVDELTGIKAHPGQPKAVANLRECYDEPEKHFRDANRRTASLTIGDTLLLDLLYGAEHRIAELEADLSALTVATKTAEAEADAFRALLERCLDHELGQLGNDILEEL